MSSKLDTSFRRPEAGRIVVRSRMLDNRIFVIKSRMLDSGKLVVRSKRLDTGRLGTIEVIWSRLDKSATLVALSKLDRSTGIAAVWMRVVPAPM